MVWCCFGARWCCLGALCSCTKHKYRTSCGNLPVLHSRSGGLLRINAACRRNYPAFRRGQRKRINTTNASPNGLAFSLFEWAHCMPSGVLLHMRTLRKNARAERSWERYFGFGAKAPTERKHLRSENAIALCMDKGHTDKASPTRASDENSCAHSSRVAVTIVW